jgi:hypothetical protein
VTGRAPRPPYCTTLAHPDLDAQRPFDVAVVMPSLLRPSLTVALQSIYDQDFAGRIQILVGIDQPAPGVVFRPPPPPPHIALTLFDPGYSTSVRHGGLHPARDGGALRCVLSYLANSRHLAYLDDDNWWAPEHLASLTAAIGGHPWAYALRWFVHPRSHRPIAIDRWESVGPGQGFFDRRFGGFVDTNALLLDKLACEPLLRLWTQPLPEDPKGCSADRTLFAALRQLPHRCSGRATSYYVIDEDDEMHQRRLAWLGPAYQAAAQIR